MTLPTRTFPWRAAAAAGAAALLAACATPSAAPPAAPVASATILRTAHGVPHISAPDLETLAYGLAYAHAQDNVCLTAQQLVTVRGERSRHFGPEATALLGRRPQPNRVIDAFVAAYMDDAALEQAWQKDASADVQALARGYVAGYNRFLADEGARLPVACRGQGWVRPMTLAEFRRLQEVLLVQAGIGSLADAVVAAQPPAAGTAALPAPSLAQAEAAARELGLLEPPIGSNAWAFGRESTETGAGLLVGNPHFPWAGANRFWQMHLTVPGRLDVMGAATGQFPMVQIGFNRDVAWSHTVSTGKRFTLHELALVPGQPTSYRVDGRVEKMRARTVGYLVPGADGEPQLQTRTLWSTRWGPVLSLPSLGLAWTAERAYAIQDANAGNARAGDAWLRFAGARSVQDLVDAHGTLGMPWINTIAADRHGRALYADVSVVPDVDDAMLKDCAPSARAAGLLKSAGIVVLDGSRAACHWRHDPDSPVPGLIAPARMPVALRSDWVHNANDSFWYTHPAQAFPGVPLVVGDSVVRRVRTRADLAEIPALLRAGPVTLASAQAQLLKNRNFMADMVLPDLLAACAGAPSPEARDGCAALKGWDRLNNLDSRGAHLFREFWRAAQALGDVHAVPFDRTQPVLTPRGLKIGDPVLGPKLWGALEGAVKAVRAAGFALDAPLGQVQRPLITDEAIPLHGGSEAEGVLNNVGNQFVQGIGRDGLRIDYGSSYIQTVTFDDAGPVAEAVLTYGQSTDPASPHANDQMKLYSAKQFQRLPFSADEVARSAIGPALVLQRR